MDIHHYHHATGAYLGTAKADPDQMQPGEFLVPAFATVKEPPAAPAGFVAVFDRADETWSVVASTLADKATPASALTKEQRIAQLRQLVKDHGDGVAQLWGFDDMADAVSYADEPSVALFQERGAALRAWRSQLWHAFEQLEVSMHEGTMKVPTMQTEFIELLPAFTYQEAPASAVQ